MKKEHTFLYSGCEEHASIFCNGTAFHIDGFRSGPDNLSLPLYYASGFKAIFHLLSGMLPGLIGIDSMGIWTEDTSAPFLAWDLLLLTSEDDGFFLPMSSAASLFSRNGIPYFHRPLP